MDTKVLRAAALLVAEGKAGNATMTAQQARLIAKALVVLIDDSEALQQQLAKAQAQIGTLKTTPPDKREDLHCVISDLCEQVRAREEQLEAVTNQRDEWVKTACKTPELSATLKFSVEQGSRFQRQLTECQAALALKDEALEKIALIDLGRSELPNDFGFRVLQVRKAYAIKPDNSALREWGARLLEDLTERGFINDAAAKLFIPQLRSGE